jgi:hypothetical protein
MLKSYGTTKKEEQPELAPNKERTLLGFNKPDPKVTKEMTTCPGVLFDGSRMLAFKIFENDETLENVTITAQAPDGPLSVSISIDDECFLTSGKLVHQMAARRQIQELEDGNSEYIPEDVKEQISDLALKYCIASKHTSFIGVDKKTRKSVLEPAMITRQIQQEVPCGFGFGGRAFKACYAMPQMAACAMSSPPMAQVMSSRQIQQDRMCSYSNNRNRDYRDYSYERSEYRMCSYSNNRNRDYRDYSYDSDVDSIDSDVDSIDSDVDRISDVDSTLGFGTRSKQLPASSAATNSVKQQVEDDLTKLINLQTANGSFKFGTVIQDLIGMTERQMIEKFHETEVDVVWITALALALLENKFTEEKELWELIANKAKMFIQTNAKTNFDDIMTKAKAFLA